MIGNLIIAGTVIVAGIAAYKLWKAGKSVTGSAVVDGVKTEVKQGWAAVLPAIKQLIAKLVAKYFFKK